MSEQDNPRNQPAKNIPVNSEPALDQAAELPADQNEKQSAETDAELATDKAVEDIMKTDGDDALKAQDEQATQAVVMKQTAFERFKNFNAEWWANPRKRYGTLGVVALILAVLIAVPYTRYNLLGLVLKAQVSVTAVDSKTGKPISGADVTIGDIRVQTDAEGKATLKVGAGSKTLQVAKKYYSGYKHPELITLSASKNQYKASLGALGRQVSIKLVNKITNKPASGVTITVGDANAKTDSQGMATIVTPSSADTQSASISGNGFNTTNITIVTSASQAKNTFPITPSGKLYFLSNLSGTLDVVKTNLDGTDRKTVLAGTGNEDRANTSLLASRDWKYLALLSKRSGTNASIYLIDTTNGDKLTTIDEGNADFSLVGWNEHRFVYQVTRNNVSLWQSNRQALKSFNAETGQTLLLDQTQASGTDTYNYLDQYFSSPYIIGNQVVYSKGWQASMNNWQQIASKTADLDTIGTDGSGHKTIKSFSPDNSVQNSNVFLSTTLYEPSGLYVYFETNGKDSFYEYEDGTLTPDTKLTADTFYSTPYPTYLQSPSGNSTFWADQRDGKNTLFVGDADAKNQKQIATLSDYNSYGWYTDNYLLLSKNSSELYIMPVSGGTALKITDYYKPNLNYNGYGGGYGGR